VEGGWPTGYTDQVGTGRKERKGRLSEGGQEGGVTSRQGDELKRQQESKKDREGRQGGGAVGRGKTRRRTRGREGGGGMRTDEKGGPDCHRYTATCPKS
jgi:hypothetical protein